MSKGPTSKEPQSAQIAEYAHHVLYRWDPPYEELGLPRPKKRQSAQPPAEDNQPLARPCNISAVRDRGPFRESGMRAQPAVTSSDDKPYFSDWRTIYRIHALWDGLSPEGQHYVLQRLEQNLKTARKPKPRS
jgi:hypothetical protein